MKEDMELSHADIGDTSILGRGIVNKICGQNMFITFEEQQGVQYGCST